MAYTYIDDASGEVKTLRSSGGTTLVLQAGEGSSFGSAMSSGAPMPVSVFDANNDLKTILKCTGRSTDTLTIAGTLGGYSDLAIQVGWKVACVPSALDLSALWTSVDANTANLVNVVHTSDLAPYATTSALTSGLAAKENSLPSDGTSGQFLAYDKTWKTPPSPDLSGYATTTALSSGLASKANATTVTTLIGRVDTIENDYVTSSDLSGYATTSYVDAGLSSKQDTLPSQSGQAGKVLGTNGSNLSWVSAGGTGTVTSVALSMPSGLTVSGSPVTTSGTLAVTTSLNGIVKGTGSGFTTASAGTDYVTPSDLSGYVTTATTDSLSSRLDVIEGDYVTSSDLSGYATTSALTSGLAGKEPTITAGSSSQYLKGDKSLGTFNTDVIAALPSQSGNNGKVLGTNGSALSFISLPSKAIVPIARWVLASSADLTSGAACTELADVLVGYTLVGVTANAQTNGDSGGFTFNVQANGSNVFSSAQTYSSSTTTSASYTTFSTSALSAGDLLGLNIASTGSGVRNVSVTLWGRES